MKKVAVLLCLVFLVILSGCAKEEEFVWHNENPTNPIPWEKIQKSILKESNPMIGGYRFTRIKDGQEWEEWGEWYSDKELEEDPYRVICFGYFVEGKLWIRPGYRWVTIPHKGRNCIQIEKDR